MVYLFVYGLFRDSARNLLGGTFCGRTTVNGKIYKVNEFYPGITLNKKGLVFGDVYLINEDVFPELDEFEGDEYIRTKVRTSSDIECWIYEYIHDTSNFKEIECGDWMLR